MGSWSTIELTRHLEETLNASRLYLDRGPRVELAAQLVDALAEGIESLDPMAAREPDPLRGYLASDREPDAILDDAVTLALCFRQDRQIIGGIARSDVLCLMAGLGRTLMLLEREAA